jgi:hypothetical protein
MSARTSRLGLAGLLVLLLGLGTGCSDFLEVTNPGPLTDEQLNDPAAMAGLVTGMSADLSFGLSRAAFVVSLAAGEQNHGGSYLWAGQASRGLITDAMEEAPHVWGFHASARWVAEAGLDRMQEVMGGTSPPAHSPREPISWQATRTGFWVRPSAMRSSTARPLWTSPSTSTGLKRTSPSP